MDERCTNCGLYLQPVIGNYYRCDNCEGCICTDNSVCDWCLDRLFDGIDVSDGTPTRKLEGQVTLKLYPPYGKQD